MRRKILFIVGLVPPDIVKLYQDDREVFRIEDSNADLSKLLAKAGLSSSRKEAIRNGFGLPVNPGYTAITYGKEKHLVEIFKSTYANSVDKPFPARDNENLEDV